MIIKIKYSFAVSVNEVGNMHPYFKVFPNAVGKYLSCLSANQNLEGLEKDINLIKNVLEGKQNNAIISDKGDCAFKVSQLEAELIGFYEEFEPIKISTVEFLELFEKWFEFLTKFYSGKIPYIIPEHLRNNFKIVEIK